MLTAIDSIDRLRRNWCKSAEEAKELRIAVQGMEAKLRLEAKKISILGDFLKEIRCGFKNKEKQIIKIRNSPYQELRNFEF